MPLYLKTNGYEKILKIPDSAVVDYSTRLGFGDAGSTAVPGTCGDVKGKGSRANDGMRLTLFKQDRSGQSFQR